MGNFVALVVFVGLIAAYASTLIPMFSSASKIGQIPVVTPAAATSAVPADVRSMASTGAAAYVAVGCCVAFVAIVVFVRSRYVGEASFTAFLNSRPRLVGGRFVWL